MQQRKRVAPPQEWPRDYMDLTPPIFGAHHRGRGWKAIRAFMNASKNQASNKGCFIRYEVGQMEDLSVEIACPTVPRLNVLKDELKKTANQAAKLQGIKKKRRR